MGVINKQTRIKALDRQKLLHNLHCKSCVNRNVKNNTKYCAGCAIWDEFQQLGRVLNRTVRERAIWDYDEEEVS